MMNVPENHLFLECFTILVIFDKNRNQLIFDQFSCVLCSISTPGVNSKNFYCLQVCAVCKKYVDFVRDKVQSPTTGWENVYLVIASDFATHSQHRIKPLLVQHYQKPYQTNVALLYFIILNIYTKRLSLSKQ